MKKMVAPPHHYLNQPSFDLGIDDNSEDVMVAKDSLQNDIERKYKDSLELEDLSFLIVEDSLEKNGEAEEADHVQDSLFADGEVNSPHDDEVTKRKIESSNGVENGAAIDKCKYHFDPNKVLDEVVPMVNMCTSSEEVVKSSEAKNLHVVQPCERALLDLNKGVFDLNKLPGDKLDFVLENEELKKVVHDMLEIYLGSLYYVCLKMKAKTCFDCVFGTL